MKNIFMVLKTVRNVCKSGLCSTCDFGYYDKNGKVHCIFRNEAGEHCNPEEWQLEKVDWEDDE